MGINSRKVVVVGCGFVGSFFCICFNAESVIFRNGTD